MSCEGHARCRSHPDRTLIDQRKGAFNAPRLGTFLAQTFHFLPPRPARRRRSGVEWMPWQKKRRHVQRSVGWNISNISPPGNYRRRKAHFFGPPGPRPLAGLVIRLSLGAGCRLAPVDPAQERLEYIARVKPRGFKTATANLRAATRHSLQGAIVAAEPRSNFHFARYLHRAIGKIPGAAVADPIAPIATSGR